MRLIVFLLINIPSVYLFGQNAKIRQELTLKVMGVNNVSTGDYPTYGLVTLNTSSYSGTVSYYFEILGVPVSGTTSGTIKLRRLGTTTDDATITLTNAGAPIQLYRSPAFTPPSGSTTYFIRADNLATFTIRQARIIIIQEGSSSAIPNTETQIDIPGVQGTTYVNQSPAAPLSFPNYWKYNSSNWDGTLTFYAEAMYYVNNTTATIVLQESDGTGDGFVGWSDKVTLVSAGNSTSPNLVRSASFTPVNGRNYRLAAHRGGGGGTRQYWIENARIIVVQTGTITKLEPQYFVGRTLSSSSPEIYGREEWITTEWANTTNTYKIQVDATDGNTGTFRLHKLSDNSVLATITSPDNSAVSSSITMPSDDELYISSTGNAQGHGLKLLVEVVGSTPTSKPRRVYTTKRNNNHKQINNEKDHHPNFILP